MKQIITAFIIPIALIACSEKLIPIEPGQQCLDSFKMELQDPESGKVLGFHQDVPGMLGTLTYTATNSFNARVQAKAKCYSIDSSTWKKDNRTLAELKRSTELIKARTECIENSKVSGKTLAECKAMPLE